MASPLSKSDFTIGDLVKCKSNESNELYGQVVDTHETLNEIEVIHTKHVDGSILEFELHGTWQPVECVEVHVPVNCNFTSDSVSDQVAALCDAWKYFSLIPLDENTLWFNGRVPNHQTSTPTISANQRNLIRECWSEELDELDEAVFASFCDEEPHAPLENEYDFNDGFVVADESEAFTVARDNSAFTSDTHKAVTFMNYREVVGETKRQRDARMFLNHLHMRVAHERA